MCVRENPFASRFVRPGAAPFLFAAGDNYDFGDGESGMDVHRLIGRLASFAWRGAIVGPHGSGKSTLLAELSAGLVRRGFDVQHAGAGNLPVGNRQASMPPPTPARKSILVVDGFDGLSLWRRWLIRSRCLRNGVGLVVTSHAPVGQVSNLPEPSDALGPLPSTGQDENAIYMGLPLLFGTIPSVALAERIASVLAGEEFAATAHNDIRESFARHAGNLREVLFDLYDLYERQARHERTDSGAPAVHSL